jgi:hypothetical protein
LGSATLNNHSPAIFCTLFTIYPLLRVTQPTRIGLLFAGFFAGLTATFELPAVAFAAGVLVLMSLRMRVTNLAWYVVGALVPLVALLACNYAAMGTVSPAYGEFGGPWYRYPGSHWLKLDNPNARGIDFNKQGTLVYAFNLLMGHHGWFSLTPIWCVALYGLVRQLRSEHRRWAWMTLAVSVIVFAFYLTRTKSYNYGGNTAAARWLIWLTPLWLFGLLTGADRLATSKLWRQIAAALLGWSVISVFYPAWNPWRAPWLLQLAEYCGWVNYG